MQNFVHSIFEACFCCWLSNHHAKMMTSNCRRRCEMTARHVFRRVPPNQILMRLDSIRELALASAVPTDCAQIHIPLDRN